MLRDYGQERKNIHVIQGRNSRLDTVQAAILRIKLPHLEQWNEKRKGHARAYTRLLQGTRLTLPAPDKGDHVFHLYVVRSKERDRLQSFLSQQGVGTGIHYPVPIHLQPAYEGLGHRQGDFPVSEQLAKEILSLPMFPELREDQIAYVADQVRHFLKEEEGVLI
jgi:dTDP-4-amino-4,6-dideoxygalactose transaminase